MKKYISYILCGFLFWCPYFVLAEINCNSGDYKATINLDKNKLTLNDKAVITVTSEFEHEVLYKINTKNVIEINNVGVVSPIGVGNTKVDVIVNFINEEEKVSECISTLNIDVLNHDSSLKLLNLEEIDISPLFQSDKLDYEIKLPYYYNKINIIAEANDSNAEIIGDGRRYLNEGSNIYEIVVKATDGSSTTYKITILREDANDDKTLKSLIVEGYVLTPKFSKDIYEYTLNVDKNVEDITISAEPTYEFAKIFGVGNYKLASGDNTFNITVLAENNEEQIYKLVVNKNQGNSKLVSLEIEGHNLDKKFSSDDYTYSLTVNNDVEQLKINAISTDNDKIEILGNEKLEVGENSIIIRVSNEDKGATTYKLLVNKLSSEEEEIIEKNNQLLKILLIIFIVSFIIMVVLIGIFLIRNFKRNKKYNVKNIKKNKK